MTSLNKVLDLHLHQYKSHLQTKTMDGQTFIWDPIRKKYLVFQPEELVRQLVIQYLIHEVGFSIHVIQVEKSLELNGLSRRYDLVVYDKKMNPYLLVECKSHKVKIIQETFDQIARYNISLQCPFLIVTNGLNSYCCAVDIKNKSYKYISTVPLPIDNG